MNEFIEQFLVECRELVDQATDDLVALEEQPDDRERLDGVFRAFHTLKGAAGIVEFAAMETALHAAEDVLSAVRSGADPVTPALVGDGLACLDQVVQWLDAMQASGEPPADAQAAADAIVARFAGVATTRADPAPAAAEDLAGPLADLTGDARSLLLAQLDLLADSSGEPTVGRAASAARVAINILLHADRRAAAASLEQSLSRPDLIGDPQAVGRALRGIVEASSSPAADVAPRDPTEPALRSLRVDVERIDSLVSLTGQLTVAQNALAHAAALAREGAAPSDLAVLLKDQHAVLNRLVGELQHSVLNIRVLPLRHVFQRFPRLVREMVVSLGKPARLVTEGDAVEADKAIVESLFEPLLHVLRNALDHGIEGAELRAAAGKPPSATIELRAAREGDRVHVEVEDDGGGVDLARVRAAAVAKGVVAPEILAEMSDEAVVDLIFAPGFSTADEVSHLSGRGVGMDAVRNAIDRLGGRVAIESRPGQGTIVRFVLPFTVMMNQVMTVEAGGQLFGVPLDAVVETVRLPRESISPVGAARAFVLRNRTIPLIDLREAMGDGQRMAVSPLANIVIAATGGALCGLEVDRFGERMDVMLRPMDGMLAGTPGVAGATLMGDGRVLIVLDLHELLR